MPSLAQILGPIPYGLYLSVREVWSQVWWIVLPVVTAFIFWEFWVLYIQYKFIVAIKWDLIEVKVPKEILKTPKAMEQIFAAAHAPYSYGLRFEEKYWKGMVEYWFSFDIVGFAGESHFYIRTPKMFRNLIESAIYSQYPGAEIFDAEDYVKQMPRVLPNEKFEVYGDEKIFRNPNCYPLRTYPMFEEAVEERRIDPIAGLLETMSKLKDDQQIWIQCLIRPTGDDWRKEGEELVNKMAGKEVKKKPGFWETLGLGVTLGEAIKAPFEHPSLEVEKKEKEMNFRLLMLTPSEKEILEGIQKKVSKLGFQTTIRFIYIDKRETFNKDNVAAVTGFFRQFNTQDLNLLKPDKDTMTAAVHGMFVRMRLNFRRRVVYEKYRDLVFNPHKPVLNIEELATIYHFPIMGVGTTYLEKIESKKGGPPPSLPLIEEDLSQ